MKLTKANAADFSAEKNQAMTFKMEFGSGSKFDSSQKKRKSALAQIQKLEDIVEESDSEQESESSYYDSEYDKSS